MNCRYVSSRISAYIDNELTGSEMIAVRNHISECSLCKSEEQRELSTKRVIREIPVFDPPSDFENRLLAAVASHSMEQSIDLQQWPRWKTAFIVAAAAAIAFGVVFFQRPSHAPNGLSADDSIRLDQDWNAARSPFQSQTIPAGLETR